jgi:hypothetical protein
VLAGSACRHPAAALPHLPLSLLHPTADTGPRCRPASPVSRAALRRPRLTALPCSPACLCRERELPPPTVPLGAILTPWSALPCRAWAPLSPVFLPPRGTEPTPPISLFALPARPLLWRRRRCFTPLCVHVRARAPLLLHRLRAHRVGSRHRRPLLLSSSRPSTAVVCHYR